MTVMARMLAAFAVLAAGAVHLWLYAHEGYSSIHVIGTASRMSAAFEADWKKAAAGIEVRWPGSGDLIVARRAFGVSFAVEASRMSTSEQVRESKTSERASGSQRLQCHRPGRTSGSVPIRSVTSKRLVSMTRDVGNTVTTTAG